MGRRRTVAKLDRPRNGRVGSEGGVPAQAGRKAAQGAGSRAARAASRRAALARPGEELAGDPGSGPKRTESRRSCMAVAPDFAGRGAGGVAQAAGQGASRPALAVRRAAPARRSAGRAGALVVHAAAYAEDLYTAPELRPVGALEMLIAPSRTFAALERLSRRGYRIEERPEKGLAGGCSCAIRARRAP